MILKVWFWDWKEWFWEWRTWHDFGVSHFDKENNPNIELMGSEYSYNTYGEYSNTTSQTLEFLIAGFGRVCLKIAFCGLNDFCCSWRLSFRRSFFHLFPWCVWMIVKFHEIPVQSSGFFRKIDAFFRATGLHSSLCFWPLSFAGLRERCVEASEMSANYDIYIHIIIMVLDVYVV